ncbi:MAG: hypothetical protein Pars92KO_31630 [Parasphingorhabdus sp.]
MARPSISPEKRAEMRSSIRDAVVRIARQRAITPNDVRGWSEITIRDVIKEAGISIGTFYKYFEDRADLAQTLWSIPVDRLRTEMQTDYDAAGSSEQKVRILLERYAEFAVADQNLFTHIFLSVPGGKYRQPKQVELCDEPFYSNLKAAFLEGQERGHFREFDPHKMAQIFWAAIHGCLALPINLDRFKFDNAEEFSSDMIEELMAMILDVSSP